MQHKFLLTTIVIGTFLFSNFRISAQDTEEKVIPKIFGLGVHIEQSASSNYTNNYFLGAPKIAIAISPIKNLRLEPEIGFNLIKNKDNDLKSNSVFYGLGTFGMFQREKTNFYGGLRIGSIKSNYEYIDNNTGVTETNNSKTFSIGPSVGAEYFLGKHFSIGAEVGINFSNFKSTDSQNDSDYNYTTTNTGILFRFYF